ncbi:sterile alpha motif domain-containing protein 3-like [Coregonus clupeaformis]|uniref:sterile alpha motif domain-containing protein 3-like n=1 Tax=Coregonus clupeaformis TaxID=59861 RepID=UPI001BE09AED|nr:sterile alpha motif domain-containing protein 3-like [Coregonus clupeaformis]
MSCELMEAEAPQNMIFRVIEADRVRKLKLSSRPASVDAVIEILKEQLELDCDFSLQYKDPDFDGKLTCLVYIEELPQKACVHISVRQDSSSLASTDTLSDVSSPERLSRWPPGPLQIPTFAFDVELTLRDGNAEFEKNERPLQLSRDQKHNILDKLASTIYGFKAYPSDKEIAMVAEALVRKHPCLKEAGSDNGWNGWKNSIKFKMGNYRTKMRRAGCQEVAVNAGKRSRKNPENEPSHSNIKRPKCAEVNFLPNFPQGEDPSSLDLLRQAIVEEVKKTERNLPLICKMMQNTFALRRQTIVMSCPPVKELMDLWPALHMQSEELHDVHTRRTTVLHALPDYLLEEVSGFFRTCVDDMDEPDLWDASVVLLTTVSDDATSPVHYHPVRVSVVLEGDVVVNLPRLADAFLVMFGLIYALHLSYPKGLTNTFEFTQKILLKNLVI